MPRAFWKEPFLEMAQKVWAMAEEHWIDDSARRQDIAILEKYAIADSPIDEVNFRAEMLAKWREKGSNVNLKVRELPGRTRVVFLGTDEQWSQIPWAFWARIFQAIEHPIGHTLIYAHPQLRVDPTEARNLSAADINGGFSYLGHQEVIVLYRYEELTRVLLHELLHTLGFDSEKGVEDLEAHTEGWTELFLCALLSRGHVNKFTKLWTEQVNWMAEQVESLQVEYNVNTRVDYAWRYMKGKMELLESMGFLRGFIHKRLQKPTTSLRFTAPSWDAEMQV
jgi:hypothetical protein